MIVVCIESAEAPIREGRVLHSALVAVPRVFSVMRQCKGLFRLAIIHKETYYYMLLVRPT